MKQPFWKKLLSYFFEIHIESTSGEFNSHLYVSLKNGRYQLCSENAIYSFEDLYTNFLKAFATIEWTKLEVKNVLVLGFGLGSVVQILEKNFGKKFHYTGVEADETVLYLAHKYVLPKIQSPVELVCTRAENFVLQTTRKFDLILMDVFLDDKIPPDLQTTFYLSALKERLSKSGLLLYNRLAQSENDVSDARLFFEKKFKEVFPDSTYLDVGGNWILINKSDVLKNKLN
ncbi:MAG TPA: hypothetical protein PKC40_12200 [Saprospiraceae bacterium]|nr:hypothetical protein [Saprospiraceae bacterium]